MHKLTITLKQHTPLIHFQHDQDGATLRASEVKPKLDRYILSRLTPEQRAQGENDGWIKRKNDKVWLDYKMKIEDVPSNVFTMNTNQKKKYTNGDKKKDEKKHKNVRYVHYGDTITDFNRSDRFVITTGKQEYFGKLRKSDSKIIYDLDSYPCFFANMDSDINDSNEYRKVTFAEEPFCMVIQTKYEFLYDQLFSPTLMSSFFLNYNFGTRQSKGFGSFYIDENDDLYIEPTSMYHFDLQVDEECYSDEFVSLFNIIELFTKTLRAGINEKRGQKTVFYFKSLAFLYCKNVLNAEWDKKRVKNNFYFDDDQRRNDSLSKQQQEYENDDDHDILFFDAEDGYDIRDLMGFSTNEEWQSYKDSIEKKVAVLENGRTRFPRRDETLPVDRMRSPLLIKPICSVDEEGNVLYDVYLIFQDEEVGMSGLKRQINMCFYSKKEKDEQNRPKRFMLNLPQNFSLSDYFDFIFNSNRLNFDIATHVEQQYQNHDYYTKLEDIYSQIKENL